MVFEVFRKRQKQFLVALTLLAMFAFVLAGLFDNLTRRSASGGRDVVLARAWGHDIRASQVAQIQQERIIAERFLRAARQWVGLQNFDFPFFPTSEDDVIGMIIMVEKGQQMGLSVTSEDVTNFIHARTENKLSKNDFFNILTGQLSPNDTSDRRSRQTLGVSEGDLYRILGREVLLAHTQEALLSPVLRDSPYDVYKDVTDVSNQVQLEVVKVPASRFTGSVGQPEEAALKKIYDEGKNRPADPTGESFGFLRPAKIDANYLVAKVDKYLDKVTVTDPEAEKYYNDNKDRYRAESSLPANRNLPGPPDGLFPPMPPTPLPPAPTPEKGTPKVQEGKPAATKKDAAPAKTEKPAKDTAPAKPDTPAEKKADKKTSLLTPPGLDAAARILTTGPILLQAEKKATKDAEAKAKDAAPKVEVKKAEKPAEAKPDPKPAKDGAAEKPATGKAEATKPAAGKADVEASLKALEGLGGKPAGPPAPQYKPLSAVKAEIVEKLRRDKAIALIAEEFRKINRQQLTPYLDTFIMQRRAFMEEERKKTGKAPELSQFQPPSPPDFQPVAKAQGFEFKNTGLVTRDEALKIPGLGTADLLTDVDFPDPANSFVAISFQSENPDLFRGRVFKSAASSEVYLAWLIRGQKPAVPTFEEAKNDVIAVWKEKEAEPKAKEAADRFAAQARKEAGDLAKVFPKDSGYAIQTTRYFPRITGQPNPLMMQRTAYRTVVDELPGASNEMMDGIFEMKRGDIKVFADALKRNYYIVKVKDRSDAAFPYFIGRYESEMNFLRAGRSIMMKEEWQQQRQEVFDMIRRESGYQRIAPERGQESPLDDEPV